MGVRWPEVDWRVMRWQCMQHSRTVLISSTGAIHVGGRSNGDCAAAR